MRTHENTLFRARVEACRIPTRTPIALHFAITAITRRRKEACGVVVSRHEELVRDPAAQREKDEGKDLLQEHSRALRVSVGADQAAEALFLGAGGPAKATVASEELEIATVLARAVHLRRVGHEDETADVTGGHG